MAAFGQQMKKWVQAKVARHKFLRGGGSIFGGLVNVGCSWVWLLPGVVVIDVIPKR